MPTPEDMFPLLDTLPPELAMDEPGPTDEQLADPEGFDLEPIADDDWAEWAMRRLVRAQTRIIDATLRHDNWTERIRRWYDDVTAADRRIAARLTESLESYAKAERERSRDKRKTIKLPSGTIETRRPQEPTIVVVDEKAALKWCEDTLPGALYEQCVSLHPNVLVSELRKVLRIVDVEGGQAIFDQDGNLASGFGIEEPTTSANVHPHA